MHIFSTQAQADAFCTVIALGYIIGAKDGSKKNTYIIFQEGDDETEEDKNKNKKTVEQHSLLRAKLAKLAKQANPDALFEFKMQRAVDKSEQPLIMAHTGKSILQNDFMEAERRIFNQMESKINKDVQQPLRGVYVGGFNDGSKTELLDPSILYWYGAKYRAVSDEDACGIERGWEGASSVTQIVQNFLENEFAGRRIKNDSGAAVLRPYERPLGSNMLGKPTGAQLFASVHGMTQSIIHYSKNGDGNRVNIELALGKDTCKVASCIPCSMFMWANDTPASATHFGRGDNWNFPDGILELIMKYSETGNPDDLVDSRYTRDIDYGCVKKWVNCVQKAYIDGKKCFEEQPAFLTSDLRVALRPDYTKCDDMKIIPRLFLEALTFEGPFLNKMLSTLKNMP